MADQNQGEKSIGENREDKYNQQNQYIPNNDEEYITQEEIEKC